MNIFAVLCYWIPGSTNHHTIPMAEKANCNKKKSRICVFDDYNNNHIACVIIAISSSVINPKSHSYSIATFSNRTLKEPVKMHYSGSCLSATSYNINSSE